MEIDKERLKVIGKLIGIYRENLRDNSQNEYTMKKFCEDICSVNTLKTIESGGLARSIEVYVALLKKLHLRLGSFPIIDITINEIMSNLYKAIDYFDYDKIDTLTTKGIRLLDKVKDYAFYSEILNIISDIRGNYLDAKMIDLSRFSNYMDIYNVIGDIFSDIIVMLMFNRLQYEFMTDSEEYRSFVEKYNIETSQFASVRMIMLHYYNVSSQYFKMKKLIDELEHELLIKDNKIRLIDVYNHGIIMTSYSDPSNIYNYINKQEKLALEVSLSKYKLRDIYSIIGNSLHNLNEYEKALEYYNKNTHLGVDCAVVDMIFMADCQNRLNKTISIPDLNKDLFTKLPERIHTMYKYFLYKDMPDFAKENYILKEIAPTLKDEAFIKVFKFEIERLVSKSGHYKNSFNFEKILQNI